jgi:hypothetical protein
MKKYFWVLIPLFGVTGYLLLSLGMYQRLINEGAKLDDKQCLSINPLIIEKKNAYNSFLQVINDEKAALIESDKYFSISKKYVDEQAKVLEEQKAFMNRWDVQFFLPKYMNQAAQYRYESRNADIEAAVMLYMAFSEPEKPQSIELEKKAMEQLKIRDEAEKKYNKLWDNPGRYDWRAYIVKPPTSPCPAENFDFPNVEKLFTPEETNTPNS